MADANSSYLDRLEQIRGVIWEWNQESTTVGKVPGATSAGVLAQDVEAVFPALVVEGEDGYKRVMYNGLIAVLIESVKELRLENQALAARIAALEGK
jgi:hypothetical protein